MEYSGLVVLIVEDNPDDLELILDSFGKARIPNPLEVAKDGQEALDYVFCKGAYTGRESILPRLILLDLVLPKVGGLEVLRILKADADTKAIPVVILTSSREERELIEAYRLGVNGYIQKPVNFAQFQKIIQEMGHYWLVVNQPTADPN